MKPSTLWLFAHRALSPQFHEDPARFVATLDTGAAPHYLEQMWQWAVKASGQPTPAQPPLSYVIDRPDAETTIVVMQFRNVSETGEPWQIRLCRGGRSRARARGRAPRRRRGRAAASRRS